MPQHSPSKISSWLSKQPLFVLVAYSTVAAFLGYMSMYAFRKPWSAISYEGISAVVLLGISFKYKTIAAIFQLLGYMGSKFLGIKFASEAPLKKRVPIIIGLIFFAEMMLLGFANVPAPYNLFFLLLNGLPLGMVWSMMFGIVEGRRYTEFLGLGMSISVIFSSAWVKDVGRWFIDIGTDIFWMPFMTGLFFIPVLVLAMLMLWHIPPPDAQDIASRSERTTMNAKERSIFLKKYLFGVIPLVLGYMLLMAYRNIRDDFMIDILEDLGYSGAEVNFGAMENWVGLSTILMLSCLWLFKNNRTAVKVNMLFILIGALLVGSSTLMVTDKIISPKFFMIINGIGLYIAFVPYQSIFMDRILAVLPTVATASFLIALSDSYGYLTVLSTYLFKDIIPAFMTSNTEFHWAEILNIGSYIVLIGVPMCLFTMLFGSFRKYLLR